MSDPDDEGLAAGAGGGPGADAVRDPERVGDDLDEGRPLVTRFDAGPRVASIDARQMRASIGARLFGSSADPVRVGRYTIIKRLGAGGMGVVYAAFDEQLDRKIALKILKERAGGQDASEQLLLEAQALARLSHPNVVQVFEVGRHEGRVFIAMEYVEGKSLRDWNQAAGIDEVLAVFIEAARGLQAAHKKGLIHRDFKPENVLVDEDGRARVLDFGLARGGLDRKETLAEGVREPSSISQSRDSLVVTGTAAGTPAYMAPEQFELLPLTPATDQFAFCVTLWERVVGQRPFPGKTLSAIYASVSGGEINVTGQERLSPALRRVLRRGLSRDPEARWPSMEALIEAIQHVRARPRRVRRWAAGTGLVALMSASGVALVSREVEDPCASVEEAFAAMWSPARAEQMRARFASLDLPYGADAFNTVSRELEAYAGRWREAQSSACAASVEDEASVREMGMRRGLCLAQRRRAFEEVVRMLSQADEGLVERSVDAVERLPAVESCDASAGLGAWSLPDDPIAREAVEELSTRLARAETATRFFRYEEAAELVEEVIAELESVRHDPTMARAYLLAGKTYRRMRRSKEASTALSQARRIADRLGDDLLRARALVELVRVVGNDLARFAEGLEAADDARAALERLGGQPLLLAELEDHVGSIYRRQGRLDEARNHHERARELIEERLGTDHVASMSTHRNLGIVAAMAKDYEGADAAFERSLELVRDRVGERHPALARQLLLQANVASLRAQDLSGEERTALARRCEGMLEKVLEVQRSVYGEADPRLDDAMHNLGVARMLAGDFEAARAPLESALERTSRALRPDHPDVVETKAELGRALVEAGEYERAEQLLTEVLEVRRQAEQSGRQLGRVELSLAERFDRVGDPLARRHLTRAREEFGQDLAEVRLTERERFNELAARLGVPELGS